MVNIIKYINNLKKNNLENPRRRRNINIPMVFEPNLLSILLPMTPQNELKLYPTLSHGRVLICVIRVWNLRHLTFNDSTKRTGALHQSRISNVQPIFSPLPVIRPFENYY
jgi:hypothetical protein